MKSFSKYIIIVLLSVNNLFSQNKIVVIDPGHGYYIGNNVNSNWGQETYNGQTVYNPDGRCKDEIETSLAVALKLKNKIEILCANVTVYLTRDSNVIDGFEDTENVDPDIMECVNYNETGLWLSSSQRACFSNRKDADLYLSIHTNAFGNTCGGTQTEGRGTETFYCEVYSNSNTNIFLQNDIDFANKINQNIVDAGDMHPRNNGIAVEYFSDLSWTTYHLGALNYNQTPNKCLNEIGFHTHIDDLPKLLDDDYRNLFTDGYFNAIIETLNIENDCTTQNNDCNSNNEPNNTQFQATPVYEVGHDFSWTGSFVDECLDQAAADIDWYRINLANQGELTLTLSSEQISMLFMDWLDNGNVSSSITANGEKKIVVCSNNGPACYDTALRIYTVTQNGDDAIPYTLDIEWSANAGCSRSSTETTSDTSSVSNSSLVINGDTSICEGLSNNLSISGDSGPFDWIINGESVHIGNNFNTQNLNTGQYDLFVISINDVCSFEEIQLNISSELTANAGTDISIENGDSAQLEGDGGSIYFWSPSDSLDNPNIYNPIASPSETTTYTLTVMENGCSDTDTVTVIVEGDTQNNPPQNDLCNNSINLVSNIFCDSINGTIDFALNDTSYSQPSCDFFGSPNANDVFYSFIAQNTTHSITVNPSGTLDAVVTVYTGNDCFGLEEFACEDTSGGNGVITSLTSNNFVVGQEYWIRIYDYGSVEPPIGQGGFSICVTHPEDSGGGGDSPDIVTKILSTSNNNPDSGDNISVTYEVSNIGNEITPFAFVSSLYFSTNQILNTSNDIYLENSVVSSQPLAPNETDIFTVDIEIPDVSEGQYYILAIGDSVNINEESNENNNVSSRLIQIGQIEEDGVDFDIDNFNVSPDNNLANNQEVEVTFDIENEGNEDADNFEVAVVFDFDNDGIYDVGQDPVLETISVNNLDAGEEDDKSRDVFLPSNITSTGNYRILLVVDSANEVNETDESNNVFDESINVGTTNPAGPDLIVNFLNVEIDDGNVVVDENSLCLFEEYTVRFEMENIGNSQAATGGAQMRIRAYISLDEFLDGNDISIGSAQANTTLNVGATIARSEDFDFEGLSTGDYFMLLVADSNGIIDEIDESNNLTVVPISVANCNDNPLPDLGVEIIQITPYQSEFGDTLEINTNITNIGDAIAENFSVNALLSTDDIFHGHGGSSTFNDHRLGDANESGLTLNPGETINITLTGYTRNDNGLQPPISDTGIHFIYVKADYFNDLIEVSKSNNVANVPIDLTSVDCYFNFDSTEFTLESYPWQATSYPQVFEIISEDSCPWGLSSEAEWIFLSTPNGEGGDLQGFSLQENEFPFSRSGEILLNGEIFYTVNQEAKPCVELSSEIRLVSEVNTFTNVDCGNNGLIDINVTQGFPPYSYEWSNGAITQDLNNLTEPGVYSVIISDQSSCTMSLEVTIEGVNSIDSSVDNTDNILTALENSAQYQWGSCDGDFVVIDGEISQTFSPTQSGMYAVELINDNCTVISECLNITCDFILESSIVELTYESQAFENILSIETLGMCEWVLLSEEEWIIVNDNSFNGEGSAGFEVLENTSPFSRTASVTISNGNSITFTQSGTPCELLSGTNQVSLASETIFNIDCFNSEGGIDISVVDGFPPYEYMWSDGSTFEDLDGVSEVGDYSVLVTDSAECIYEWTFEIIDESGVDTNVTIDDTALTSNQDDAEYQWIDCDNNDAFIGGATGQSFVPTETGNYAVIVNYGDCEEQSACFNFEFLSIENNFKNSIKVYPNPTSSILNIDSGDIQIERVIFFNMLGQVVKSKNYSIENIDISNIASGVYILSLKSVEGTIGNYTIIKN